MVERIGQIGALHGEVCARRDRAESVRPAGPVRFSEALERQNEEFRRARRETEVVARLLAAGIVRGVFGAAAGVHETPAPPMRRADSRAEDCKGATSESSDARATSPELRGPRIADRPAIDAPRVERVTRVTAYQTLMLKRGGIIDIVV
ncbi:MAG: hypothetical protein U0638_04145 [Phycisphaerales bacterium]